MVIDAGMLTSIVFATSWFMLAKSRTSTATAVASFPASLISRSTVLIVDMDEFGSGGKGTVLDASLVDFAATTTASRLRISHSFMSCATFSMSVGTYQRIHSSRDRWRFGAQYLWRHRQ